MFSIIKKLNNIAFTTMLLSAATASADSATWVGNVNSDYTNLNNWSGPPASLPGTGPFELATFDNSATNMTVDFTTVPAVSPFDLQVAASAFTFFMPNDVDFSSGPNGNNISIPSGSIDKTGAGTWSIRNLFIDESATFSVSAGQVTASGNNAVVSVGTDGIDSAGTARLEVDGDGISPGSATFRQEGFVLNVGQNGRQGVIEVTNKGRLESNRFNIGTINGLGAVTLDGADTRWIVETPSAGTVSFLGDTTSVDGSVDGSIKLSNGAYMSSEGRIFVGRNGEGEIIVESGAKLNLIQDPNSLFTRSNLALGLTGGRGTVLVDGAGSELNASTFIYISGALNQATQDAVGTLTVSDGGKVTVGSAVDENGVNPYGDFDGLLNLWEDGTVKLDNGSIEIKGLTGGTNGTASRRDDNRFLVQGRLEGHGEVKATDLTVGGFRFTTSGANFVGDATGTVAPGTSSAAGAITVKGQGGLDRVTFLSSATFEAELFGNANNDMLVLDSGVNNPEIVVNGTLDASAIGPYVPTSGDTFTIISHGAGKRIAGVFSDTSSLGALPAPGAGEKWEVLYKNDRVVIEAISDTLEAPNAVSNIGSIAYNYLNFANPIGLDGFGSMDPDSPPGIVSYTWTSDLDPSILLNTPTFNLTDISSTGMTATTSSGALNLTVIDDDSQGGVANVPVSYVNSAPSILSASATTLGDGSVDFFMQFSDPDFAVNSLIPQFERLFVEFSETADPNDGPFTGQFAFDDGGVTLNVSLIDLIDIFGGPGSYPVYAGVFDRVSAFDILEIQVTVVPEPSTYALLGAMLGAVAYTRRRKALR